MNTTPLDGFTGLVVEEFAGRPVRLVDLDDDQPRDPAAVDRALSARWTGARHDPLWVCEGAYSWTSIGGTHG